MTTAEIGVAIQGAGWVSTEHIRAYMRNDHARIVAIGSRTTDGARRKARELGLDVPIYDSLEKMLARPDVDALSICTPPSRHCEEAIMAAHAGKHMVIEKPIAVSVEELRSMDEAVRAAGVRTVVSFVLRWSPAVANIKALQSDGYLGKVFFVQSDYWHNGVQAGIPASPSREEVGAMVGGGCHAVDLARYVMESDVVSVSARGWSPDASSGATAPANLVAVLGFENGGTGRVSACTTQWMPYQFNIDVLGTRGSITRGNRLFTDRLPGLTGFSELETVLPDNGDVAHHPFPAEIDHFIDCVLTGTESHVNVSDAVNTHEVCFAAELSAARDGEVVRLPMR